MFYIGDAVQVVFHGTGAISHAMIREVKRTNNQTLYNLTIPLLNKRGEFTHIDNVEERFLKQR